MAAMAAILNIYFLLRLKSRKAKLARKHQGDL